MVNEFVKLSPKKENDSNDEDCYSLEKNGESSDEDTTSSSLIPVPDTLDMMRNELKSAFNDFCTATDLDVSPKSSLNGLELNAKCPTERELSLVRKITSANLLFDDLLNVNNIQPKELNPLVFHAKEVRAPASETSGTDPSTESSSSAEQCHGVGTYLFPPAVCECHCPCERKISEPIVREQPTTVERLPNREKNQQRKGFFSETIRSVKMMCKGKKEPLLVNTSQQTHSDPITPVNSFDYNRDALQGIPCTCQQGTRFLISDHQRTTGNCTCSDVPRSCTCPPMTFKDCHCEEKPAMKDAQCGPKESLESGEQEQEEKINRENNGGLEQAPPVQPSRVPFPPVPVTARKARERIDVYYFDHGNAAYYRTTDSHPAKYTEYMIERTDEYATKFWAEVFGTVTIAIAFVISFILQLYRCLFTAIIRALTVGLIQIFSDYFFKPLLTVVFNGLIQPCLILGYNVATSTKDFCVPVCEIFEFCAKDLAIIFRSCRFVEVKEKERVCSPCQCKHNV